MHTLVPLLLRLKIYLAFHLVGFEAASHAWASSAAPKPPPHSHGITQCIDTMVGEHSSPFLLLPLLG